MNLEKADQHQKIVLHSLQQRFIPARSTISRHHLNAYCHRPHQGTVATSDTAGQAFSAVMPHRLCETYLDSHLAPSLCLQPDRMHLNATKPPMPTDDAAQYSTLLQALQVSTSHCAKDVAAALILSEAVYKAVDSSLKQAVEEVVKISADLPPILHQPLKVQWSLPHVFQRYLIAEGESTLYVAFMGTKLRSDLITNAKVYQEQLWTDDSFSGQNQPAAHTGFVRRARSVPTRSLLQLAQQKGKRLVFCGHSLGGGIAELCVLDLLHTQPAGLLPDVKAIGFATPAIGNLALADHVKQQGWQFYLSNYLLPEDKIGRLLAFSYDHNQKRPTETLTPYLASQDEQIQEATTISKIAKPELVQPAALRLDHAGSQQAIEPSSNILTFPASLQRQRKRRRQNDMQVAPAPIADSYARVPWSVGWIIKFAYRTLTFPLWAHQSYIPLAQRFYLNPTGVSEFPEQSQAACLAFASQLGRLTAEGSLKSPAPASKLSSKNLLMWMHRLPAYRTRFHQIWRSKADMTQSVNFIQGDAPIYLPIELSSTLSGPITLDKAVYCHLGFAFDQSLPIAVSKEPDHPNSNHTSSLVLPQKKGLLWVLQRWICNHIHFLNTLGGSRHCILIHVQGHGLQKATTFQLKLPSGQAYVAEVLYSPSNPVPASLGGLLSQGSAAALLVLRAWLKVIRRSRRPLPEHLDSCILRVKLPSAQARLLKNLGKQPLQLLYRTDFEEGMHPVKALLRQKKRKSPFLPQSPADWLLCQKCG